MQSSPRLYRLGPGIVTEWDEPGARSIASVRVWLSRTVQDQRLLNTLPIAINQGFDHFPVDADEYRTQIEARKRFPVVARANLPDGLVACAVDKLPDGPMACAVDKSSCPDRAWSVTSLPGFCLCSLTSRCCAA